MIVLFDVDGVFADLLGKILDDVRELYPHTPTVSSITNWGLFDKGTSALTEEQRAYAIQLLDTPGYGQTLPLIDGAQDGYEKFKQRGHQVQWLTSSWRTNPTWEYDRRIWIKKNFGSHKYDINFVHNKWFFRGDYFLDDKVDNVVKWSAAHPAGKASLYNQPWNQHSQIDRFDWSMLNDDYLDSLERLDVA